jgi:sulfur-oxidizing protein SoxZ
MAAPRIKIPKKIIKGEPFEVKTLISHKMESGQRKNEQTGENFPRKIINTFICKLDGEEVFRVKLYPAVSANPFLSFYVTAEKAGELAFIWIDDDGTETQHKKRFEVDA